MPKQIKLKPARRTHDEMVAEWMKDPAFKAEYDALEEEYQLIRQMLLARKRAGLTQKDVAELMGTKAPAVASLESTSSFEKHSPSYRTLRKYANAVGCTLKTTFVPLAIKRSKKKY